MTGKFADHCVTMVPGNGAKWILSGPNATRWMMQLAAWTLRIKCGPIKERRRREQMQHVYNKPVTEMISIYNLQCLWRRLSMYGLSQNFIILILNNTKKSRKPLRVFSCAHCRSLSVSLSPVTHKIQTLERFKTQTTRPAEECTNLYITLGSISEIWLNMFNPSRLAQYI